MLMIPDGFLYYKKKESRIVVRLSQVCVHKHIPLLLTNIIPIIAKKTISFTTNFLF